MTNNGFTFERSGSWPFESYKITPSVFNSLKTGVLPLELQAFNIFRYLENPTVGLNKLTTEYNIPNFTYSNGDYQLDDNFYFILSSSSVTPTFFTWNPSNLRDIDSGYMFNFFLIKDKKIASPFYDTDNPNKYFAYSIYPTRLLLQPTNVNKISDSNFTLTTQTKLISSSIVQYYDTFVEDLAYTDSILKKSTIPIAFETLPSTGTLIYTLSSFKTVREKQLINFTERYSPYTYYDVLDEFLNRKGLVIRPDSTFITYVSLFYGDVDENRYELQSLGQVLPEFNPLIQKDLRSSFILNQNISNNLGTQTFQLLQSSISATYSLENVANSIQTVFWNLTSGYVKYDVKTVQDRNGTLVPLVTGKPDSRLAISYTIDGDKFYNDISVGTSNNSTSPTTNTSKTWNLSYPPHYYTFKVSYSNNSTFIGDTATLNFYLSSGVTDKYKSSIQPISSALLATNAISYSAFKLKTKIVSDFNFLELDLATYANKDLISFKCLYIDDLIVKSLSCFYGPNLNEYYDLLNSPYIPAVSAENFIITYPKEIWGQLNLNFKATLSSVCTTLDSKSLISLVFSEGKTSQVIGFPIEIELRSESDNQIITSCAKLSTTSVLPCRDLTDSFIKWSYEPTNLPVTIAGVDYNQFTPTLTSNITGGIIPNIFSNGQILPFSNLTNTVMFSGYGNNLLTVKLESLKYEEVAKLISNPIYFDFFKDKTFVLYNSNFTNIGKTTNFSISSKVLYGNSTFDIPTDTPVYWKWTYNGNINPLTMPITAYKSDGSVYQYGSILSSDDISTMSFKVYLEDNDNSFDTNEFKVNLFSNYKDSLVVGELFLYLNDYPDKNIFNVDFKTVYSSHLGVDISNTRDEKYVITRPKEDVNNFKFISNTDVLPNLSAKSITWFISSDNGYFSSLNYFSNKDITYTIPQNSTKTTITLSAERATVKGWSIENNLSTTLTIFTIPSATLNKKLNFLIYPPYTWLQNNSGLITLLNNTNYTLANAPTAYYGKLSNTQNFLVSCSDKSFSDYEYYYSNNKIFLSLSDSYSALLEIPYHQEIYSNIGSPLFLSAYNEKFPKYNGINYIGLSSGNVLYNGTFNITTSTLPFSSSYINGRDNFLQSPKLVPYDSLTMTFSSNVTAINLDENIFITASQSFFPINSSTSPIRGVEEFLNGNVLYTLSCKYWEATTDVSPISGIYDLFILRIGDPSIPLNIRDNEITTLLLSAYATTPVTIPESTFRNVTATYTGETNLWGDVSQTLSVSNPITLVAYSTSVKPKFFVSSYYSITGDDIWFQFETPENSYNYKITAYDLFFGDGLSARIFDDQKYIKTYSKEGAFKLSYNVYYNDGTTNFFKSEAPIIIYNNWPIFDQQKIRLLSEITLNFGDENENTYDLDQIKIQPNEWGDADIFNTAITRLQDNLDYLIYNSQTMNTDSPTFFYGWLGTNTEEKASGITWHTLNYNKDYLNSLQNAISLETEDDVTLKNKFSYFKDLKDIVVLKDKIYAIDGSNFRAFSAGKIPQEMEFENITEINSLLINPISIDCDITGENVYICDTLKNKVYKLNIDFETYPPQINIQLSIGNLGQLEDTNKFHSPTEVITENDLVFVLDYNNKCVKQYTKDLNWMFTYYSEDFETDQPINISVHPKTFLVYVLTQSYKVYIFDYFKSDVFETLDVSFIKDGYPLLKIFFDESGDFFYILNSKNIYKYTTAGTFINQVAIPNDENIFYTSAKYSYDRSIVLSTKYSILRFHDILNIFKIGDGLPYRYWTRDQLKLSNDEFPDDITYNRSLNRLAQNIKSYRDTLDSRFVIVTEKTDAGTIEYFSLYPVSYQNRPIFSDKIENETLGVGVNEFHVPQVFNRELEELYNALLTLKDFLNIKDVRILNTSQSLDNINTGCDGAFCWSWKAMSCYNLSLPIIRICNINPITYSELESKYPIDYIYATSNTYGLATSKCCEDQESPIK